MSEKYLTISILSSIKLNAWKNKDKTAENKQPDYKGDGIAVWINEKKEKTQEEGL